MTVSTIKFGTIRQWIRTAALAAACLAVAATAWPQAAPSKEDEQVKARQRISTMEGVLERAVSNGAENLLRQVRTVMPDAPMLSGVPKVRGFRLDGYGVFFDVEVPALRLPVTWPLRYLIEDNRAAVAAALAELRTMIADQPAAGARPVRDAGPAPRIARRDTTRHAASGRSGRDRTRTWPTPRPFARRSIDAMIEHSGPMPVGA